MTFLDSPGPKIYAEIAYRPGPFRIVEPVLIRALSVARNMVTQVSATTGNDDDAFPYKQLAVVGMYMSTYAVTTVIPLAPPTLTGCDV